MSYLLFTTCDCGEIITSLPRTRTTSSALPATIVGNSVFNASEQTRCTSCFARSTDARFKHFACGRTQVCGISRHVYRPHLFCSAHLPDADEGSVWGDTLQDPYACVTLLPDRRSLRRTRTAEGGGTHFRFVFLCLN